MLVNVTSISSQQEAPHSVLQLQLKRTWMKLEQAVDMLSVPVTGARSPPGSQLQLQWSPTLHTSIKSSSKAKGCCIAVQDSSECVELVSPEVAAS